MHVPYAAKALESGQDARIVQIDFSAAFDRVNNQDILYRLCSVGIGGSVLSILTQFLSNRSHRVMVDGCLSKLVDAVSGVPQGSVLGPLLFLLYTSEIFSILENKLIGYADDSTLMAVVPSPGVIVAATNSYWYRKTLEGLKFFTCYLKPSVCWNIFCSNSMSFEIVRTKKIYCQNVFCSVIFRGIYYFTTFTQLC